MPLYGSLADEEGGREHEHEHEHEHPPLYHNPTLSTPAHPLVEPRPSKSLLDRFYVAGTALLGLAALAGVSVQARGANVDLSGRAPPSQSIVELALSPDIGGGQGDHALRFAEDNTTLVVDGVAYEVLEIDLMSDTTISDYIMKRKVGGWVGGWVWVGVGGWVGVWVEGRRQRRG